MSDHVDYSGLAAIFDLSADTIRRLMPGWVGRGFPAPLPWSRRDKRWNRAAVLAWKAREEARLGAREGLRLVG